MLKSGLLIVAISALMPFSGFAHEANTPPELWSSFKQVNKSSEACKIQSAFILGNMGVQNIIQNEHGVYGTIQNNRVVVKCLAQDKKSLLWVAVAGSDKNSVELLRNKIITKVD